LLNIVYKELFRKSTKKGYGLRVTSCGSKISFLSGDTPWDKYSDELARRAFDKIKGTDKKRGASVE